MHIWFHDSVVASLSLLLMINLFQRWFQFSKWGDVVVAARSNHLTLSILVMTPLHYDEFFSPPTAITLEFGPRIFLIAWGLNGCSQLTMPHQSCEFVGQDVGVVLDVLHWTIYSPSPFGLTPLSLVNICFHSTIVTAETLFCVCYIIPCWMIIV